VIEHPRRLTATAQLTEDARPHVLAGCYQEDRPGSFWRPSLRAGVGDDSLAARVEPCGPMALTTPPVHLDTDLRSSNRLGSGLAAFVWFMGLTLVDRVTDGLEAGAIAVDSRQVSPAGTPFGGVGQGGLGYEGGKEGLRSFHRTQSVIARTAP
jgi:succinate-semialdehyde dehydrogenase/glutarate-semialdehyde dehydrogenase